MLAEKILVRRVTACVDALTIQAQRAAARGDGGLCATLALIFADFLTSSCPPVRHAAGVGLQCIAGIEEVRAEAERLLPAMLVATNDSSAVPDHNARCACPNLPYTESASSRSRLTVARFCAQCAGDGCGGFAAQPGLERSGDAAQRHPRRAGARALGQLNAGAAAVEEPHGSPRA